MSESAIERLANEYATAAASSGYQRSGRQVRKAVAGLLKHHRIATDEHILGVVKLGRSIWVLTTESLFDTREGKYGLSFDLYECSFELDREVVSVVDGPDRRELTFADSADHVDPPGMRQAASERARRFFALAKRAQADYRRAEGFADSGQWDDAAEHPEPVIATNPGAELNVRDQSGLADRLSIDDDDELVQGETPLLARQLVAVDGYRYADIRADELADNLELIMDYEEHAGVDLVVGASWHPVVANDPARNTTGTAEVGFLCLLQRCESVSGAELLEHLRAFWVEGEPVEELEIAGAHVLMLDTPSRRHSRFAFTWTAGDVTGVIDGADRVTIERWLAAYLGELPSHDR